MNRWAAVAFDINTTDFDEGRNKDDNSDHLMVGRIARDLQARNPHCNLALFVGYDSKHLPQNLSGDGTEYERRAFRAYAETVDGLGYWGGWDDPHFAYLGQNHYVVIAGREPAYSSAPAAGSGAWVKCADEGAYCAFRGERRVGYGANSTYVFATVSDGVACLNDVFGDPSVGTVKSCEILR